MAVKEAYLESKNPIVVLVAPNRTGKTQILLLLYSILSSIWRAKVENSKTIRKIFHQKFKNTLLLRKAGEAITYNKESSRIKLQFNSSSISFQISKSEINFREEKILNSDKERIENPIYIQPAGLGDYYKGIFSLKKYYPNWNLISEAITDLLTDLLITSNERVDSSEVSNFTEIFERLFGAKFFIQNERIFVQEKGRKYGIERTASGLKSISWLYLIVKYNLLKEFLFLDEPEVNLHPEYIDKLTSYLIKLSEGRKIFIATHSDYLLESLNKYILKGKVKVDVWNGYLTEEGAIFESQEANEENLIDTSPLNEVYRRIVKELFEYEEEIGL